MCGTDLVHTSLSGTRYPAGMASKILPSESGIYAIFADVPESLPEPFCAELKARDTTLIYIGKAGESLLKRLYEQDLRHKSAASFFRSLGAVLGYTPTCGSLIGKRNTKNYKFSAEDTARVIRWIDEHLLVSFKTLSQAEMLLQEPSLIRQHTPLLNLQGNPKKLMHLEQLRSRCRDIGLGTGQWQVQV